MSQRPEQSRAVPVTTADSTAVDAGTVKSARPASAEASLARSSAGMAAGTITSRLLGMVRTSMLAGVVGLVILPADAFDVANTLPNQFYLLLAGGVLNAVLVPQIAKAASHDDGGHVFVNRLLTLSLALMALATVVVTAAAPLLIRLYSSPRWTDETRSLATAFALICLPQIFFYGLYTLLGQVLNARSQFAAYMWAPALMNVVALGGLVWFRLAGFPLEAGVGQWTMPMIWLLAGSSTLGVVAQAVVLLIPLHRSGFRYRPVWGFRGVGLRSASRVAMWTFAAVAVSQLGFAITSQVLTRATQLAKEQHLAGAAGKAAYSNAFLLFMLPHSLITVSLVTALFTRLAKAVQAGRTADVVADLGRGLRMPAVFLVPGTFVGLLLGPLAVQTVFLENSRSDTAAVAHVMMAMLLGIVPFGWLYLVQRVYYAYEDARTPFYLQLVVTGLATGFNLLGAVVSPAQTGVVVGLGQTASNVAAALLGFVLLRRRLGRLRLRDTARTYVRLVIASLAATAACWALKTALLGLLGRGVLGGVLVLVVTGTVFFVIVFVLAHLMRVREVDELVGPILRRARRVGRRPSST